MTINLTIIDEIDRLLPQTQCERCAYPGCRPYAEAIIVAGAPINRCAPGGHKTMQAIATLLKRPEEPLEPEHAALSHFPKKLAKIDESKCIGCTLCIQACPVDAIVGAAKQMHTILEDACTGCELCIEPCPMDCIQLEPTNPPLPTWIVGESEDILEQAALSRERFRAHNTRIQKKNKPTIPAPPPPVPTITSDLQAAIARAKAKRQQLGWRNDT